MARILFAWELGAGRGHLAQIAPLAGGLAARGHEVFAAVPDPLAAQETLSAASVLPAPKKQSVTPRQILNPGSFAEVLHNVGWHEPRELAELIQAWRRLFHSVQPNLVVLDYSPTALLALHGLPIRCVQTGTGFYCPVDRSPLPDLCPWQNNYPDRLEMTERDVLANANHCLAEGGHPPLARLAALSHHPQETVLGTFRELDHYPNRPDGDYWGIWSQPRGARPNWPAGEGPRIFVYLRPWEHLAETLAALASSPARALIYLAGGDLHVTSRDAGANLRFSPQPIDTRAALAECDFVLSYASHTLVAETLLAGKPMILLPTHGEQLINALHAQALGAAVCIWQGNPIGVADALQTIHNDPAYARGARSFAAKYADFDPDTARTRLLDLLERHAHAN